MKKVVILNHSVKEYSSWRNVFNEGESDRLTHSIRTIDVLVDAQAENNVTVFFEVSDMAKFNSFLSSPELKTAMEAAGVTSAPDLKVLISKN